ncbi:xaa-Pro aminopeptidase-like protein [Amylocarpus encephaloides]|uniref:Xaa-Pro aminopeptidase n=1 Tax=Amylocarpus encephaloides TaxID=45428 RepID=A0A9P8C7S2_9HELO|nr:xaa-Pro aminopeptidase-like protein [Amylocarpus encephaloides]
MTRLRTVSLNMKPRTPTLRQLTKINTASCLPLGATSKILGPIAWDRRPFSSRVAAPRRSTQHVCWGHQASPSSVTLQSTRSRHSRRAYASISAAELQFGQPVHETHPHLLGAGEITPGITAQEYSDRRSKLASSLPGNGIAILAASDTKYRSGAVFYEFHQDPNFLYLTGFNEPEAVAVIQKLGSTADYNFHLFLRPKDAHAELWDGARSGEQAALDVFNADESGDIKNLPSLLQPLIDGASDVYTDITTQPSGLRRFFKSQTQDSSSMFQKMVKDSRLKPLKPLMNNLRVVKSEAEIANMRMAGKISGRTFTNAMRQQFSKEKDLGAFMDYNFKIGGCETSAYIPVIAGGKNALAIHYVSNNAALRDGEIVLVDAGGQYGGYIADITRTWPINGRFSDAQRDLYEAILRVQRSSVSLCRESSIMSLDNIHEVTQAGLKDALKQLGFDVSGDAMDVLFPHHVGHYVGLDVHDCPGFTRSTQIRSGYCVTVEPGIYVPNDERWPKHFQGLGIRIEDSVCVQDDHPLILTTEAVKEIVDIEALRD